MLSRRVPLLLRGSSHLESRSGIEAGTEGWVFLKSRVVGVGVLACMQVPKESASACLQVW